MSINPKLKNDYPDRIYLGKSKTWGHIYMSRPSWDCDWYWGFGYIGNKKLHTHLEQLPKEHNTNLYDTLITEFGESLKVKDVWTFCEVVQTIYTLRKTAELYNRGGSHYTTNPCKDILTNIDEYRRINEVLIPELIDEMYKCF